MRIFYILFFVFGAVHAADDAAFIWPYPVPQETPSTVLIKNATLWTMEKDGIQEGFDLLIEDGKIKKNIKAPKDALVIDATGKHVTPGLIDAHSHSAVEGFGVNEMSNSVTAEVRIKDILDPFHDEIYLQLSGGLTAANVLHGSANAIGGQSAVIKFRWGVTRPRDLVFKEAPESIKFALGENPKRSNFRIPGMPSRYPTTRMGVEATIRDTFNRALDYKAEWERFNALNDDQKAATQPPRHDLQLQAISEIVDGKRLVHSHGYRADEFLALLRVMEEFGVKIATFQHILEGYKIADEMAAHGVGGSTFSDWWAYKIEAYDAIPYNAALMTERGVLSSVNSDDGVLARRMNIEAAKSVRYGNMTPQDALALVTINPAKQLGVDSVTGSLKTGKHADVVVWNGSPLSVYSSADYTLVDGVVRFSRERDAAYRKTIEEARTHLAEEIKNGGKKKDGADKKDEEKPEEKAPEEVSVVKTLPQAAYTFDPLSGKDSFAIVGASVHTISGSTIENGTVVVRNGKIAAVGGSDLAVPGDVKTIDASGKHLWPGLIHANNSLGLVEIDSVSATMDDGEMGDWNANIHAHLAYHPDSKLIPVARSAGITHVFTMPNGGIVTGTGSLMRTQGWTWEETAASRASMMGVKWPEGKASGFMAFMQGNKSLKDRKKDAEDKIKKLSEYFDNAALYHQGKDNKATNARWQTDNGFENMKPVLDGSMPLFVFATESWAMKQAVEWAMKRELAIVIVGGHQSARIAGFLAKHKVPVILTDILFNPERSDEAYDTAYTTPRVLFDAGVSFAITGIGGDGGSGHIRNMVEHAGFSAAFGLPKEEAWRAVTLNAAKLLGVDHALGSIEEGKSASLALTDGDLLEVTTHVEQVWIDGVACDMSDKQKQLYERYRNRPRK